MKTKQKRTKKRNKDLKTPVPKKSNKGIKILTIFLIIAMIFLIITLSLNLFQPQKFIVMDQNNKNYYYPKFISFENSTYVSMYLPAVDENSQGIITTLGIEAVPGSGRVLVDIENLVFWDDTQESIRTAKKVVGKITKKNMSEYDFVYTIHTDANMVGGPSAGAAIAIATIAAIEDKKINENVMITGSIKEDGKIGKVTAISAKAEAAKKINITTFLVPQGQSKETYYEIKKSCKKVGLAEFCTIEQIPHERDISEKVGIEIIEVSTIEQAIEYFFDN
jgi:uncharacterized protein